MKTNSRWLRVLFSLLFVVVSTTAFVGVSNPVHAQSGYADKKETVVYITKTGKKYHRAGCRYLKHSRIKISKADAIEEGYTACKVCRP